MDVATAAYSNITVLKPVSHGRVAISDPGYEWRDQVIRKLEELVRLSPGWDGYQAQPVSLENAFFAILMLDAACKPGTLTPSVVPGGAGDLQIEWHTLAGDVELHVRAPNDVHAWRSSIANAEGEEKFLRSDFSAIAPWIEQATEAAIAPAAAAA